MKLPNKRDLNILGIRVSKAGHFGSFSGNSSNLLDFLIDAGVCTKLVTTYPPNYVLRLIQLFSFSPNYEKWKFKSKINLRMYKFLTAKAYRQIRRLNLNQFDASLQIGAWYNIPRIITELGNDNIVKCSFHDGNFSTMINSTLNKPSLPKSTLERVFASEKTVYHEMDIIFPMSEWLKRSFVRDFHVPENKLVVVGSATNLPDDLIFKGKKDYANPSILFVGTDFRRKGGFDLLDAFKKVRKDIHDARLSIVGYKLREDPPGVSSLGPLSKDVPHERDIFRRLYKEASLFVMPSLYEPFGIVFAEAMVNRIPCIGANTCAMPEIIEEGKCGFLVPVNDTKALALRIIELLKQPKLMEKIGNYCYQKYLANYTWDVVARKVFKAIRHELGSC